MDSDLLAEVMIRVNGYTDVVEGACWIWTGQVNNWGYGVTSVKGKKTAVHRIVFEASHGEIPEGFQVDHKCRNRVCLNPDHLQAITPSENYALGRLRNTHCKQGHEFSEENTYYYGPRNHRQCKICRREAGKGRRLLPTSLHVSS